MLFVILSEENAYVSVVDRVLYIWKATGRAFYRSPPARIICILRAYYGRVVESWTTSAARNLQDLIDYICNQSSSLSLNLYQLKLVCSSAV